MLRFVTIVIAMVYGSNGLAMLTCPTAWYLQVPGVSATGPLNVHFVRDIGFAYVLCGAALARGSWDPKRRAYWVLLGSAWPALHALYHLSAWLQHGVPAAAVLASETLGVVLPVLGGAAVAVGSWPRRDPRREPGTTEPC